MRLSASIPLTQEQVFSQPKGKHGPKPGVPALRYRDPFFGVAWSGRGRAPSCIKGQPREQFLIQA
ncbi:H-NS family nucleoid-associated regulatory protein [Paraburkholderia sp. BCC1885]|uniref:H-NS family nucleoid-associated regulatory protein n=1 Tax=Paraburkholderia sp. BCC1885 TaxID=2562669 RepID=UPI0028CB2045|nr:H-NS family nucleoid-associated regulatory protein [Paraburkholderia sp. BCC1885]